MIVCGSRINLITYSFSYNYLKEMIKYYGLMYSILFVTFLHIIKIIPKWIFKVLYFSLIYIKTHKNLIDTYKFYKLNINRSVNDKRETTYINHK